nr:UvrD-like helicase, ATP-binding domain, P-loop containing nucleoside triphosphate hydrolase [Tanacetum cinerariifolium]
MVDVYIPNRKSKAGKRYAFARFIRVDNMERLVTKPTNRPIRTETPTVNTYASVPKGEAKQFMSIQKLPTILSKEGFPNVKLTYLGGLWVMMEFSSLITKEKFLQHVEVASWFNNDDGLSNTCFGPDDRDEQQQQSNQMKQASEDPFQIYDLLKKQDNEVKSGLEKSRSCPPGFTPDADDNKKVKDKVSSPSIGFNSHIMADSSPIEDQMSSNGVQYSHMNDNKKGGSILEVMDDMIKVGQTMGYTMEGCIKDMENIIGTQGVNDVFQ